MAYDSHNRREFQLYLPWRSSGCLDIYRNFVVEKFLTTEHEWLWFVDSDIEIANDTLYKLLDAADPATHPVVTGIYPMILNEGQVPSIFTRGYDEKVDKVTMMPYLTLPDSPTIEVDGCGAGCLLIHRSILTTMRTIFPPEKPWFDMGIFDQVPYGEDFTFCMRVAQMGYKPLAVTTAHCSHNKTMKLTVPTSVKV